MLIKAYGQLWNPDVITWGGDGTGAGKLTGRVQKGSQRYNIDFWNAKGIYVLHSDFKCIYVGKAFGTSIGVRLRAHLSDRLAGRWDMFSWYSISAPRFTQRDVSNPGSRYMNPESVTNTLEALAILIADPSLNRRRESLSGAYEAVQPDTATPRTVRNYLQAIVDKLDAQDMML